MGRNMIVFDCSVCGKQLKVKTEVGGKTIRCSHCGGKVKAPLSETTPAGNPSSAQTSQEGATLPPSGRPRSEPKAVKASSPRTSQEGATLPPSGRPAASVKASSAPTSEEGATLPPSGRLHSEPTT